MLSLFDTNLKFPMFKSVWPLYFILGFQSLILFGSEQNRYVLVDHSYHLKIKVCNGPQCLTLSDLYVPTFHFLKVDLSLFYEIPLDFSRNLFEIPAVDLFLSWLLSLSCVYLNNCIFFLIAC